MPGLVSAEAERTERQVTRALLTYAVCAINAVVQVRFTFVGTPDCLHSGSRVGEAQGAGMQLAAFVFE